MRDVTVCWGGGHKKVFHCKFQTFSSYKRNSQSTCVRKVAILIARDCIFVDTTMGYDEKVYLNNLISFLGLLFTSFQILVSGLMSG